MPPMLASTDNTALPDAAVVALEAAARHTAAPRTLRQTVAFTLSALLSPYIVIPLGTLGILASLAITAWKFALWTVVSIFFSTAVPALYVAYQVWNGKITDVHVMEREQRGG